MVYAALLLMVSIWGLNFSVAKLALSGLDPLTLSLWRITGAALLLFLIYRPSLKPEREVIVLALSGIVLNQIFFLSGLNFSTPARAAIVVSSNSIFVRLLELVLEGKSLLLSEVAGFLLAFSGLLFLELPEFRGERLFMAGDALVMAAAICFAFYQFRSRKALKSRPAPLLLAQVMLWAALFLSPATLLSLFKTKPWHVPAESLLGLFYMIAFTSVAAYLLLYYGLSRLPASRVAVFTFLQPVLGSAFSVLLGFDRMSLRLALSLLLVFSGIIIVERAGAKVRS